MQIEYSKKAIKYINSLDRETKQRIKKAIEKLTESPPKGDIKLLWQNNAFKYISIRIKYRIVFSQQITDLL